jgi:poly(3-hydroxybutyrate) depolymerase
MSDLPSSPVLCEQTVRVALSHAGLSRRYYYRLPSAACAAGASAHVPLLMVVHCLGGSALGEMAKYIGHAESAGFALLAPEGMWRSWNTPSCCGVAKVHNVDDFGFLDAAVQHAAATLPPLALSLPDSLFASGFSNGGFVTSLLPTRSRLRWRGLAPAAGHDYDAIADRPTPISAHHCEDDQAVRLDGCCDDSPCCCSIGVGRSACVGGRAIHARWLKVNRCAGSRIEPGPAGALCEVGVGCAANTSLCIYPRSTGCFHAQWADAFPGARAVVRFFAREVCQQPTAALAFASHSAAPMGHLKAAGKRGGGTSQDSSPARTAACAFASLPDDRLAATPVPRG